LLTYIAAKHLQMLQKNQLDTFEKVWNYKAEWFEAPNEERGGWSGVNYLILQDSAGQQQPVYLKRQCGYMRRTVKHPIAGEPTFVREYAVMQYLQSYGVGTPQTIFFAVKHQEAILMTEALMGYMAWDAWRKGYTDASNSRKKAVISAIAQMVKKMHQAGVQHRSLYPKHLFVSEDNGKNNAVIKVAIIDFEKSRITPRITPWVVLLKIADLITLNYRTQGLSRTQRLYFFKQYVGVKKLSVWQKRLCRYIYHQSLKKLSH